MLSLMVVASRYTKQLVSYMENNNSIEVLYSYTTIAERVQEIESTLIDVDKLVYIAHDDASVVRRDMYHLSKLIKEETAFRVGEFVFFTKTDEEGKKSKEYIESTFKDSNRNYKITTYDTSIALVDVYNSVLNIDYKSGNSGVRYNKVYRISRHIEGTDAFEGQDDSKLQIQPFSYENVRAYDLRREEAHKDRDNYITDIEKEHMEPYNNFYTEGISIKDVATLSSNIYTMIGTPKSGCSTLAFALAISAIHNSKKVLIVDSCENHGLSKLLSVMNCPKNTFDISNCKNSKFLGFKEFLRRSENGVLNAITYAKPLDDVRYVGKVLTYLIDNIDTDFFDVIIVDVDINHVNRMSSVISKSSKSILVANGTLNDIDYLKEKLDTFSFESLSRVIDIVVRDITKVLDEEDKCNPNKIPNIIRYSNINYIRTSGDINISKIDGRLYRQLIGGE